MVENQKILGIDFGTTNSKMAFIEMDEPTIIENREGLINTPSVVYFKENGEVLVGEEAKHNLISYPTRTVASIKRKMGTGFKKKVGNESYPAEYIGAHIFRKILFDAEARTGLRFNAVVVSVPANFSDDQRQAIKDSAEIAGINVVKLINEPTAAALAYGFKEENEKKIMVYDFGGGTFDVSILSIGDGFFDVDASFGENKLGGDDIDQLIANMICRQIASEHEINIKKDLSALQSIIDAAEAAKCALSSTVSTNIKLPFIGKGANDEPIKFEYDLNRKQFNKMIAGVVERTKKPVEQALQDAALGMNEIDEIILVGGTTKIPYVQEFIKKTFNKKPKYSTDPYQVVALGAAVSSLEISRGTSRKKAKRIEISDVISRSLGVLTADGTVSHIIKRNTKIPITRTKTYTNAWPFIREVIIPAYEGENIFPDKNQFLGDFWVDIEPMPLHRNQIDISFNVGEEFGILNVNAVDIKSGNKREVKMKSSGRLSAKEKNKWMMKMSNMMCRSVRIENKVLRSTTVLNVHPNMRISDIKTELKKLNFLGDGEELYQKKNRLAEDVLVSELNLRPKSKLSISKVME